MKPHKILASAVNLSADQWGKILSSPTKGSTDEDLNLLIQRRPDLVAHCEHALFAMSTLLYLLPQVSRPLHDCFEFRCWWVVVELQ